MPTPAAGSVLISAMNHDLPGYLDWRLMELNALILNCTLKKSPEPSNTQGADRHGHRPLRRARRQARDAAAGRLQDPLRRRLRHGGGGRVAADPREGPRRRHPDHGHVDLVRRPQQRLPDGDRAARRHLQHDQRGRPVPALQHGRRSGGDRQRGRRPRLRRDDPLQPHPPRLRDPAQRRHLLGRRRRARARRSSRRAARTTPTPRRPRSGWPTTSPTWRGSSRSTRSRPKETRSPAGSRTTAAATTTACPPATSAEPARRSGAGAVAGDEPRVLGAGAQDQHLGGRLLQQPDEVVAGEAGAAGRRRRDDDAVELLALEQAA